MNSTSQQLGTLGNAIHLVTQYDTQFIRQIMTLYRS